MNDDLMTLTDTRGREAGGALQRAATMRSWNSSAPKRPVVWLRPALVMAAVVAVLAGLVWVSGRPAEPTDQLDPAGLRYVIGEVPTGWTAQRALGAEEGATSARSNIRVSTFGTPGDATAPMLRIAWQDPSRESDNSLGGVTGIALSNNLREIAVGDDVAACADDGPALWCVLDSTVGMLQVSSSGLTDDDVGRLLAAVQYVDGDTVIEPADLPEGMAQLSRGGIEQSPVLSVPMKLPRASQVTYTPSIGNDSLILTTGWAADNDLAGVATWGYMKKADVSGHVAYLGISTQMGLIGLFWTDGVRAFALVSADSSLDFVSVAESVRSATGDEWVAIVVDRPLITDYTTPIEGTLVDASEATMMGAPADTNPPVSLAPSSDLRDVAVTQTVRPISEFDAAYSSELPDGVFGEIRIAVVANTVLAREASGDSGSLSWQLDGTVFTSANPYWGASDGAKGVIAASTDPRATQLRVTRQNGDRYLLDLVAVQNHPELKVGVVMLPPGSFVTFEVVDADGNVMLSYEGQ